MYYHKMSSLYPKNPRQKQNDYTFTSNTPSWLNACANIIIIGMTAMIIAQNNKLIQLNEEKINDENTTNKILQEIKEKL